MEPGSDAVVFGQKEADTLVQEMRCKRKKEQKTLRRNREVFQESHKKFLNAKVMNDGNRNRLVDVIINATKRASNNMDALRYTHARGESSLNPSTLERPVVIEGVNPISEVFLRAVGLFAKEIAYSQQFYPRATRHYFKFPITTILHHSADVYTQRMQVEFDCFTAPIRHPPAEGMNYLNLRDMKRLWELPHHQLFLITMLQMCKEVGRDKMDCHDMNLLMYGQREASRLFRIVVDPQAGDYDVDEVVLYAVSCAMQKWGGVLLEISGSSHVQTVRIPGSAIRHVGLVV